MHFWSRICLIFINLFKSLKNRIPLSYRIKIKSKKVKILIYLTDTAYD